MLGPMLGRRYEVKVMIEGSTKEFCHRKVDLYQFQSFKRRLFFQFWRFGCKRIGRREAASVQSQKKTFVVQRWSSDYKRKEREEELLLL